ncbi:MAG: FAD-dependent oxidoreductase [Deltaproteobacteria bacterium]|nr:FAD-dependent oxidoreductase [Deltaproteobacteria bacterium]
MVAEKSKKIIVLGGGFAGTWAAYNLAVSGHTVFLLEKRPVLGGLSRVCKINQNYYELGSHLFHTDSQPLLDKFQSLFPGEFLEVERFFRIKFNDQFFRYPLTMVDIIRGLGFKTNLQCFVSLVFYLVKGKLKKVKYQTAEDVLIYRFGKKLYTVFFEDYIEKFWGVHPRQLDASFAIRRISRLDVSDFFKKIFVFFQDAFKFRRKASPGTTGSQKDKFIEPVVGKLFYNKHGGMHRIFEKLASEIKSHGGHVFTEVRGLHMGVQGERATQVAFECLGEHHELTCDEVISSIPLSELVKSIQIPQKKDIEQNLEKIRYRSLIVVGILVKRSSVMPSLLTYYRNLSFNRLTEPKNYGLEIYPKGCTILLAEVSCEKTDRLWQEDDLVKKQVIGDLVRENIIQEEEVLEVHVLKDEHAYPVFLNDYPVHLEQIASWLSQFENIYSIGRQGMFQYVNQHVVMKMAEKVVENINANLTKKQAGQHYYYY